MAVIAKNAKAKNQKARNYAGFKVFVASGCRSMPAWKVTALEATVGQ